MPSLNASLCITVHQMNFRNAFAALALLGLATQTQILTLYGTSSAQQTLEPLLSGRQM